MTWCVNVRVCAFCAPYNRLIFICSSPWPHTFNPNPSQGFALEQNTDPVITKVIAGSFILAMIVLLVYGVVIPSLTEYDEGICSPIQNAGRC